MCIIKTSVYALNNNMEKIQVLCPTMNQKDFAKYKEMNINCDVVFANQTINYGYEETYINGNYVQMISSNHRGVGKNRNTALLNATAKICLFADDDVKYSDDYVLTVTKAFAEIPDADIIIFNFTTESNRKPKNKNKIKRCRFWNVLSYGTYRIGFRLDKVYKSNVWFTHLFGGGAKYSSGEDTMWLIDSLKKGLKIYTYPQIIGSVKQEESTWFKGYDEEYFFSKGALVQANFRRIKLLLIIYYLIRFRKISKLSLRKMFKYLIKGSKAFKKGLTYNDIKN